MRAKFINEKFLEDSDPIKDMGIGGIDKTLPSILRKILEKNEEKYSIEYIDIHKTGIYINIFSKEYVPSFRLRKVVWIPIIEDIIQKFKEKDIYKYFSDNMNPYQLEKDGDYNIDDDGEYEGLAGYWIDFNNDIDTSLIQDYKIK